MAKKQALRRNIPNHAIERLRTRTAGTDYMSLEDADLRRVLDDAVDWAISEHKTRELYDTFRGENFLTVDISHKFPNALALVMADATKKAAQVIVTIGELEWIEKNLRNQQWQDKGCLDADAVAILDEGKKATAPKVVTEVRVEFKSPFILEAKKKAEDRLAEIQELLKTLPREMEELQAFVKQL